MLYVVVFFQILMNALVAPTTVTVTLPALTQMVHSLAAVTQGIPVMVNKSA